MKTSCSTVILTSGSPSTTGGDVGRRVKDYPEVRHIILTYPERNGFKRIPFYAIKELKCPVEIFRAVANKMGYFCKKDDNVVILSRVKFSYLNYEKKHPPKS